MSIISNMFDTNAVVWRPTSTNVNGETIETYSSYVDSFGALQQTSGNEGINNNIDRYMTNWVWYCDVIDIQKMDYLVISGSTYIVENVYSPRNEHMQINLKKLESRK